MNEVQISSMRGISWQVKIITNVGRAEDMAMTAGRLGK